LEDAKEIALDMDVDTTFQKMMQIKRKRHFVENNYFIPIVYQDMSLFTRRFEQYQGYQKIFGFLFTSNALWSLDKKTLKPCCHHLEAALKRDGHILILTQMICAWG
jgi:hypothetical protein